MAHLEPTHMTTGGTDVKPNQWPPLLELPATALFLDVDGTLLEFAANPIAVPIPPDLTTLLQCLRDATRGALALISGREIATLDSLLKLPDLPAAGLHGLEHRDTAGRLHRYPGAGAGLDRLAAELAEFAREHPGVMIEHKRVALGVHYRAAPEHRGAVEELATSLATSLPGELTLQRGKMVVEIRPTGADKGVAIANFMKEPPFLLRRPVFVGDDLTDEHGFEVVNRCDGLSIKVGDGASRAHYRLSDPADVRRWLWASVDAVDKEQPA